MSVVLMRMKKVPENCCECELRQDDFDRGEEFCPFTGAICLAIGRQANCPIIGVLPDTHGRLVDADALAEEMRKRNDACYSWYATAKDEIKERAAGAYTMIVEAKLMCGKMPTIVPATERNPNR